MVRERGRAGARLRGSRATPATRSSCHCSGEAGRPVLLPALRHARLHPAACAIRDVRGELGQRDAVVLGVSSDGQEARFASRRNTACPSRFSPTPSRRSERATASLRKARALFTVDVRDRPRRNRGERDEAGRPRHACRQGAGRVARATLRDLRPAVRSAGRAPGSARAQPRRPAEVARDGAGEAEEAPTRAMKTNAKTTSPQAGSPIRRMKSGRRRRQPRPVASLAPANGRVREIADANAAPSASPRAPAQKAKNASSSDAAVGPVVGSAW